MCVCAVLFLLSSTSVTFTIIIYLHRQGPYRRVGDTEVSAARYAGGAAAGTAPDPDPQVPGERGHDRLVPHVHVGRDLSAQRRSGRLVRHGGEAVRDTARLGAERSLGSSFGKQ